jgi:predicted PurR-regulated permease PerM
VADQQKGRGIAAGVVAVVVAGCGLYLAREVFIPIAIAMLLYALLRPLVRRLQRLRVPAAVSATVVVLALIGLLVGVGVAFSSPVGEWVQKAPQTFSRAREKLQKLTASLPFGGSLMGGQGGASRSSGASGTSSGGEPTSGGPRGGQAKDPPASASGDGGNSGQAQAGGAKTSAAQGDGSTPSSGGGSTAADSGGGSAGGAGGSPAASSGKSGGGGAGAIVAKAFGTTANVVSTMVEVLLLLLFLLAMGDRLKGKVLRAIKCYDDRQTAAVVAEEVEAVVSRYVVATALINLGQSVVIALAMWALGLPTPALWGLLTFVMEFIPYLGALMMMLLLAVAGLTASDSFGHAMLAPGLYLVVTTLQNNLVSPLAYGNRLKLSPAAILVAVMIWFFLWGFAGAFVAVPVLAAVKVLADHVAALKPLGELIGD